MGNKAKLFLAKKRKRKNVASLEKARAKRRTNIKHGPNEKQYLESTTEQKIDALEQEPIEVNIKSGYDDKKDDKESRNDTLRITPDNEIMCVLKQEQIEVTLESDDDDKKDDDESRNDALRQSPVNEEFWVVRRQLCRGCHSDGAFWSLQTTTEGDTYGDLLQTYFNIQLCPVSEDESTLSAICTLCAARLREARDFSAQAHAAEGRFTRLYKLNRVRALVNEVVIKQDPSSASVTRTPRVLNVCQQIVDDFEITDNDEPDTANSNLVDDFEITDNDEPETANSNLDNSKLSKDELAPTLNNNKETQERCDKPASKKLLRLTPSDYERVGNLFKCLHCSKLYNRKVIHNHVKKVHLKSQNNTCPYCDKTFTKSDDLKFHKKVSHFNNYRKYKNVVLAPTDIERVGTSYKCAQCNKQSKLYSEVRYHVLYKHLKIPRHNCPYCDKSFHGVAEFTKHKLEEHSIDHRIKCNACDWTTYRSKTALTLHKNAFHMLGVKRTCPECDYFSFSNNNMKKHAIKHSTVKEYRCKYCNKSFLRRNTLNFHERIHTGDKRQVCNVCKVAFVQRASLTYHMAKHHPEVRF